MIIYLDLSFIVAIFLYFISFCFAKIYINIEKKPFIFNFCSYSVMLISLFLNMMFIPYFCAFCLIILTLISFLVNINYGKIMTLTLLLYIINISFLECLGGSFLYEGILYISTPFVSLLIFFYPLFTCFIYLFVRFINFGIKQIKYTYPCSICCKKEKIKGHGYYDTGNTLLYKEKPVIFVAKSVPNCEGEIIKIHDMTMKEFRYLAYEGTLKINRKKQDVYIVYLPNQSNFNYCKILLNRYVL